MEFVGRNVMKEFSGHGVFKGVVESFDPSSGFFMIVYEDGDSEEVDLSEVTLMIQPPASLPADEKVKKKPGRKPKRRRRIGAYSGKGFNSSAVNSAQSSGNSEIDGGAGRNLNKSRHADGNLDVVASGVNTLDLNSDDGLNSNDGIHVKIDSLQNGGVRGFIDLNLNVDDELGDRSKSDDLGSSCMATKEVELGFDLNVGLNDESLVLYGEDEQGLGHNRAKQVNEGSVCCYGTSVHSLSTAHSHSIDVRIHLCEEPKHMTGVHVDAGNVNDRSCDIELKERASVVITDSPYDDGNSRRRKKRKVEVDNLSSTSVTVLRRSTRRTRAMAVQVNNSSKVVADGCKDMSSSAVRVVTEEKPSVEECEEVLISEALPQVLELPPSSTNLNLGGLSVLDVFSVYAFLRSFSTSLYLSPFELEDFVGALQSDISNQLVDSIHVSVLQTLRKHLEFLSREGSESATNCLRNLNWDLLDVVTWPIFMAEYLLTHGSRLKDGFNLASLKLFENDYYTQPAEVKIEVLRCLCDDVLEADSIRSELSRRSTFTWIGVDFDRDMDNDAISKKRPSKNALVDYDDGDDDDQEMNDWNSDECCLCKMDGSLICCDGCPAAYHSRCVGVLCKLLPEGEWYCPECSIGRKESGIKPQKWIRGAEPLGVDPYGRSYFSSYGYLLVSDSCSAESEFRYYNSNDMSLVIEVLRSSELVFGSISSTISQLWALDTSNLLDKCRFDSVKHTLSTSPLVTVSSDNLAMKDEVLDEKTLEDPHVVDNAFVEACTEIEKQTNDSEGLNEVLQASPVIALGRRRKESAGHCQKSYAVNSKEEAPLEMQSQNTYVNNYDFARTASSVAEDLALKSPDKGNMDFSQSEEEIISVQLKAILRKWNKFCWLCLNYDELQKENCGWCYACRYPAEDRNCLLNMRTTDYFSVGLKTEIAGLWSKQSRKGHIIDVICYVLSFEDRLQGLLLGPWLSLHYSNFWREILLEASDIAAIKYCLLMLEANLHPQAFSTEWSKHVDYAVTMGSASHIVITSCMASRLGSSRKRCRGVDYEPSSRNGTGGLDLFWWRGGRLSRKIFNWKVLSRTLTLKAARTGGCVKIPGILYPDSGEHAKRSNHVVWRAAVEASTSVEQLALLIKGLSAINNLEIVVSMGVFINDSFQLEFVEVRVLDQNIQWDDIENTHLLPILDNETKKSLRLFKKVVVRRKAVEGTNVKYLLDFGKRRSIPDVVVRHGKMLEDSSERKKYWLDESYLPLHILKGFEEKRISRKASNINSNRAFKNKMLKKPLKRKGLDYLFSRTEREENYQCRHCKRDVSIREAVRCRDCNGFFHMRHVRKLSGTTAAKCPFMCHRCLAGKHVTVGKRGRKKEPRVFHDGTIFSGVRRGKKRSVQISKDGRSIYFGKKRGRKPKPKKGEKKPSLVKQEWVETSKKTKFHERVPRSQESANKSPAMAVRRSYRIRKSSSAQHTGFVQDRKEKLAKSGTVISKKPSDGQSWKRKRTPILSAFWVKGLRLSRKANDEHAVRFKRTKLLSSEFSATRIDQPKCPLCCEERYRSALKYIACDLCGGWFHGHAFGLDAGKVEHLIGFRCHQCLQRDPPSCPYLEDAKCNTILLDEVADRRPKEGANPMETNSSLKSGSDTHLQNFVPNLVQSTSDKALSDNNPTPTQKMGLPVETGNLAACEIEVVRTLTEEVDAFMEPAESQKCGTGEELQVSLPDLAKPVANTDSPVINQILLLQLQLSVEAGNLDPGKTVVLSEEATISLETDGTNKSASNEDLPALVQDPVKSTSDRLCLVGDDDPVMQKLELLVETGNSAVNESEVSERLVEETWDPMETDDNQKSGSDHTSLENQDS